MEEFLENLVVGEILFRDRWQFELKSEFTPPYSKIAESYSQEFYFFVPEALQINEETYNKADYYQDQTNLIRYKTPEFTFDEILDPSNALSPLTIIRSQINKPLTAELQNRIENELKLYGNLFRGALRNKIREFVEIAKKIPHNEASVFLQKEVINLAEKLHKIRLTFQEIKNQCQDRFLLPHFNYIEEFVANTEDYYLTGFLEYLRSSHRSRFHQIDQELCKIIMEQTNRSPFPSLEGDANRSEKEAILYRRGLLKKYVLDALILDVNRASLHQKYGSLIGAFAAGVAMLVYLCLYVWQGGVFVINSAPFVIITVILYILKDRLKEELRSFSTSHALKWFSDYTTEIYSPEGKSYLGEIKESFSFMSSQNLPSEIDKIRNKEFHEFLELLKRQELVICYKKMISLATQAKSKDLRKQDLTLLFRLNIQRFLAKASEPFYSFTTLDPETLELKKTELPKVYHINIILKNIIKNPDHTEKVEYKKFRIIVDKNGIRHIEHII